MVQIVNLVMAINFGLDFSAMSNTLRGWRDWGKVKAFLQPTDQEGKGKNSQKENEKKIGKNHSDNKNIRFNKGLFIYYAI